MNIRDISNKNNYVYQMFLPIKNFYEERARKQLPPSMPRYKFGTGSA